MKFTTSRRGFMAASAAMAATTALPRLGFAQTAPRTLAATTRVLEIDGRAATVYGLMNGAGGQGLILDPGQQFRVDQLRLFYLHDFLKLHLQFFVL